VGNNVPSPNRNSNECFSEEIIQRIETTEQEGGKESLSQGKIVREIYAIWNHRSHDRKIIEAGLGCSSQKSAIADHKEAPETSTKLVSGKSTAS